MSQIAQWFCGLNGRLMSFYKIRQKAKRSEDTLFHITSECWKSTRLGCKDELRNVKLRIVVIV